VAILEKAGCEKRDLLCGTHAPLYFEAMGIHPRAEDIFTVVHHNCSGKHAGMLALAKLLGAPIDNYVDAAHPVQQAILDAVSEFSGLPRDQIIVGIDGCSAPAFAMPLSALARAFACFGGATAEGRYGNAPATITAAMIAHPEMVSGIKRMDLALAHAGHGDWLPKSGAEAVHALSVLSRGFGIAVKIADGAKRALHVVIVETLRQLGLVGELVDTPLESYARPTLYNSRDVATGEVVPVFKLSMA
jgi:L-asparaginase II